jgi:hypothetical protein
LLAFDGVVITLAGSRLRMKNLGHNFGQVRLLVYFLFCGATVCRGGKQVGNLSTLTKNSGSFLLELPFSRRRAKI